MKFLSKHWMLILILLVSFILRVVNVSQADVVTDEAVYSFRSIGYLDYMASQLQTTPVDWFGVDSLPAWTKLSFHDHPPVVFLIQYLFFSVFGVSILVARLPFILAGVLSVWLVYLIGKKLLSKNTGLLAAAFLAVDNYHVWISRIGLLESVVILFSLFSFYLFLKMINTPPDLPLKRGGALWWGAITGIALLTKYTTVFLLPLFAIVLLVRHREILSNKHFWLGVLALIVVVSPVVIYNANLYQQTGHFDLQIAGMFNQETPEWTNIQRSVGFNPIQVISSLGASLGPVYAVVVLLSVLYAAYLAHKKQKSAVLILALLILLIQFSVIGSAPRFLVLFAPFVALTVAYALVAFSGSVQTPSRVQRASGTTVLLVVLLFQTFVSVNSQLVSRPIIHDSIATIPIAENDYGYQKLGALVEHIIAENELSGSLIDEEHRSAIIIYDSNINYFPRMWYFERHVTYDAVPFTSTDELAALITDGTMNYYTSQGFTQFYFIKAEEGTLQLPGGVRSNNAQVLEGVITSEGIDPLENIYTNRGERAFTVYQF